MDWLTPQIFIMTIVGILGTQVGLFLAMMKLQERNTDSQIETLKKQIEDLHSRNNKEIPNEQISIKIYQPPEWKHGKPKRTKNTRYKIGPITGIVTGGVKSAFLAIRTSLDGDLRIIKRLSIEKDGAWAATIELPSWENSKYYEIVGVAFSQDLPLSHEARITKEAKPILSNYIPAYIEYISDTA